MKDVIKKSFLLGLGAASMTKNQAEKIVKELVKKNAVTIKDGKGMLNKIKNHARNEGRRVSKFAQQEVKRVANELGLVSKVQVSKVKKHLKSINKELGARGKKTLKRIMKDLGK